MSDDKLAKLLATQKSLTEWLEDIKHKDAAKIRREDGDKRERLKVLNRAIGLPFDEPVQFEATDLQSRTPEFIRYLHGHGDELCALRLIPKDDESPKLRTRGKTVEDAYRWFLEQNLDAAKYRADFIPHSEENNWGTIFIVNQHGVQGEVVRGGHHQLTQGFHDNAAPTLFRYDFKDWMTYPNDPEALKHVQTLAAYLKVADPSLRDTLHKQLGATFAREYLEGYFETTDSPLGTWFIDYSPSLGTMYAQTVVMAPKEDATALVSGRSGSLGEARGKVHIVRPEDVETVDFAEGSVLVCPVTTPDYVPLMQKAAAIVTDQGGILSHAAIVARELRKPCIVGTGNATEILHDGQEVSVDAAAGLVFAE